MLFRTLSKIFPPPTYMRLPAYGVDISDTSLKYVNFGDIPKGNITRPLLDWGEIDIPEGALSRGQVLDQKALSATLRELKNKTKADYIRVSLPEERAYLFETEIKKNIPAKEIRSLLEFRLEENVPIPVREAFFDYDVLESDQTDKAVRVVVVAYARETIQAYYEACVASDLFPIAFEVEAQAMVRAVVPYNYSDTVMLVDFGKTRTGVGIVHDGALMYTSTIDFGGRDLSATLRKVLGDVPEEYLTTIKNTQGILNHNGDNESFEVLVGTVSVIKDELLSRIQYWHSQEYKQDIRRIEEIVLCGGSANLLGLPEYLSEALGIKTTRANVWQNAFSLNDYIPPIDARHSYGYATAIGLALPRVL